MPPKKRPATAAKTRASKKAKVESAPAASSEPASAIEVAKSTLAKAPSFSKKSHKIDAPCSLSGNSMARVVDDYDCMLNQTNIGHNNNKFYVIQLISCGASYYCWTRWGRVGETGAHGTKVFSSLDDAKKDFCKKFNDKTKNSWENRKKFKPVAGKYTLLEMGEDDEEGDAVVQKALTVVTESGTKTYAPSKLDGATQKFMNLIFSTDMFQNALEQLKLDTKKMPLGKLSKGQIMKGFEVLDELEKAIDNNQTSKFADLSSKFYTHIPHAFGRVRPPIISTHEHVRQKMDMLLVLADIEFAQQMQKEEEGKKKNATEKLEPHPSDVHYNMLNCKLEHLDKNSDEYKLIEKFTKQTSGHFNEKILNIWKAERESEPSAFRAHDKISHRKLLWHGTNVAVVAAILKTGLRIMPHSGGRVGKGIYFASENNKSAGYVGRAPSNVGIMFLCEVALGKEHSVTTNQCQLKAAPSGYDSVVARGQTEPNPKEDSELELDGKKIIVPVGKPIKQNEWNDSHFSQSEYLIYKESQCRIRYVLEIQF